MSRKLITNVNVASGPWTPEVNVAVEDGLISSIAIPTEGIKVVANGDGAIMMPGFIDIHNHGAIGHDVNTSSAEDMLEVAAFLSSNGVTAWLPTLVPDSDENYRRIIGEIDRLMELQHDKPVAQAVGVHYEGVFANEAMCGALRPEFFRKYADESGKTTKGHEKTRNKKQLLPRLKNGVHMTTLAPEIDGGIDLIKRLVDDGWIVSIGHTRADPETLDAAFEAGARHMTHFFNAMTGVHHRDVGVAGWGLANDAVSFDIIADGIHVAPPMLQLACRTKGIDKVTMISDSVAPTGLGDGEFHLWGERIAVRSGRTQNERGSIAGSVITVLDAVRQMLGLGFSPVEVAQMASTNPAMLLGLIDRGSIQVGKRADLVALDSAADIRFTMIGGEMA